MTAPSPVGDLRSIIISKASGKSTTLAVAFLAAVKK